MNQISDDLADDGRLQPGPFIGEFVPAIRSLSPETIAANLRSRSLVDYPQGLGVPDISVSSTCAPATSIAVERRAPMPAVHEGQAAAVLSGKVYVFGGAKRVSLQVPPPYDGRTNYGDEVDAYDPVSNAWAPKKSMPVKYFHPARAYDQPTRYMCSAGVGPRGFQNGLYRYDPITDEWSTLAARPTYRYRIRERRRRRQDLRDRWQGTDADDGRLERTGRGRPRVTSRSTTRQPIVGHRARPCRCLARILASLRAVRQDLRFRWQPRARPRDLRRSS